MHHWPGFLSFVMHAIEPLLLNLLIQFGQNLAESFTVFVINNLLGLCLVSDTQPAHSIRPYPDQTCRLLAASGTCFLHLLTPISFDSFIDSSITFDLPVLRSRPDRLSGIWAVYENTLRSKRNRLSFTGTITPLQNRNPVKLSC